MSIDLDELMRGMDLLGVTRADIERVRSAPTLPEQAQELEALQRRAKAKAHELSRAWHPDLIGDVASEQHADELRAVLVAADYVRALEPDHRRYGCGPRWRARVRPVDMGVRVEATREHWTD